ncbi:MAG: hypothetical protein ABI548_23060 [Polyangiaceae bacterium]
MSSREDLLDKAPEELETLLIAYARKEAVPDEARNRALLGVASAGVGVGLVAGAVAHGARPSVLKLTTLLVGKWLLVGVGSGLVVLGAAQGVQQYVATRTEAPVQAVLPTPKRAAVAAGSKAGGDLGTPEAPPISAESPPSAAFAPVSASVPVSALAARSAAPSTPSGRVASANQLTLELELLEQARSALGQHWAARAAQVLDRYDAQFPAGSLRAEAAALKVEAAGQLGNYAQALQLGEAFTDRYPTNPLSARIRALVVSYRASAQKP